MQIRDDARAQDTLADILRERDLKVTPQRIAVFAALHGLTTHPSADEVYHTVVEEYPNISFDTVNRTLRTFAEIGLLEIIETPEGVRRYDTQLQPHHHIHCIHCGRIIDFENPDFDTLSVPDDLANRYRISKLRVSLQGMCPECQTKTG
ncbi:MAG: Fur family transcriptional regulator [Spirochaetota bacterium]